MTEALRCEAPTGDRCGESPTWDDATQTLYWCDINRFLIHRLDPATGAVLTWHFSEPVTALSLTTAPGTLLVALSSRIILWTPETDHRSDSLSTLPGAPAQRLNDGRTGPDGAFWFSSMANNVGPNGEDLKLRKAEGALYRLAQNQNVTIHETNLDVPNTLCWSPDAQNFYFADSGKNTIWRYRHAPAAIEDKTPFLEGFPRGVPDGSAIDSEGHLWNCRYNGRCLIRIAPDGTIAQTIEVPAQNVTCCTFGGPDLRTLFITTAAMSNPDDRLAGSLFSIRTDTPGTIGNRYQV